MNRVTIRHIDIVRAANVVAVLYAVAVVVFGLLVFVPLGLIGGLAAVGMGDSGGGMAMAGGVLGGLVFLVFGVVAYGVMGWITTAIACWLYNLVAARIGGMRFTVDVEGPTPGSYASPYPGTPGAPGGYGGGMAPYGGPPASYPAPAAPRGADGPPPAPGR